MHSKHREEDFYELVRLGMFEIDSCGRIWRLARMGRSGRMYPTQRKRAEHGAKHGYLQVQCMRDGYTVAAYAHCVVWFHLHGVIPDGMTVNHENGNKQDNRPKNLTLKTPTEQNLHATRVLRRGHAVNQSGSKNNMAKLSIFDVRAIRQQRLVGVPCEVLADIFEITRSAVWKIGAGVSWSSVT